MVTIRSWKGSWGSKDPLVVLLDAGGKSDAKSLSRKLKDETLARRLSSAIAARSEAPEAGEIIEGAWAGAGEGKVFLALLPKDRSMYSLLGFSREILQAVLAWTEKGIGFLPASGGEEMLEALGAAVATRIYPMPLYGKRLKKPKRFRLEAVSLPSSKMEKAFTRGFETGEGTNGVRSLGVTPPNELHPGEYIRRIRDLAKTEKLGFKFYSATELKKRGAGCFTAVDQGNPDSEGGIVELRYDPPKAKNKKPYTLVGKGLCFDTGGYDIKVGGHMLTMKGDMQGSAVALHTLLTVKRLKLPLRVHAFLGITENHISPKAYKPDEVVVALNGMAVEVVDTDAEGRMVLADTLALASLEKPAFIMDFATLTGCAVRSIGNTYGAAFTNRENYHDRIRQAGVTSGERVWTFPVEDELGKSLESPIADIKQCKPGPGPDHMLAAYFLSKFVGEGIPWVHLDLAASEREGGLAHVDSTFTGFGVRFALEFLESL